MASFIKLSLIFGLLTFSLCAQENAAELLNLPFVKEKKTLCEKEKSTNIADCIWGKLNDDDKAQVLKSFSSEEDQKFQYNSAQNQTNKEYLKIIQNHFADKLKKTFEGSSAIHYGEFYKLYKERVTKSIIEAVSSFCIDSRIFRIQVETSEREEKDGEISEENIKTDYLENRLIIHHDINKREIARKVNLKQLQSLTENTKDHPGDIPIQACFIHIPKICYKEGIYSSAPDFDKVTDNNKDLKDEFNENEKYTQQRACNVNSYIKSMKKSSSLLRTLKNPNSIKLTKVRLILQTL